MKKLFNILLAILLVSVLSFSVIACKDETGSTTADRTVEPMQFSYNLEEDEDGNKTYTLTEFSLSAAAKEFVDDKDWDELAKLFNEYYNVNTYTAENVRVLTVESVHGDLPVTKIAGNAISNQSFITELVVPDSIVEIELGAFVGLSSLEKITLPFAGNKKGAVGNAKLFSYIFGSVGGTGLTSVTQNYNEGTSNNSASFYVPTSLTTVVITGEVKAETETVEYYINDRNEMVVLSETVTLPENATKLTLDVVSYENSAVQPFAFYGITTITSFSFASCTAIPDYTFYGCTAIKTLTFADEVVSLGKYAFANCTSLRVLNLNRVTILEEGAFSGCTNLGKDSATTKNTIDFTAVTNLGKDAFAGCTSLTKEKVLNLTLANKDQAFDKDFFEENND